MMLQSLRVARLPLVRICQHAKLQRHFSMAPTAVLRADLVQELYLRELKNYKPNVPKASDAIGNVHTFSIPKPPPSPEDIEIANDLKAYKAQTVEVEGGLEEGEVEVDRVTELFEGTMRRIEQEDWEEEHGVEHKE